MDRMLQDDFANSYQVSIEEASEHSLLGRIAIAGSRLLSPIL
jgi:hypothetical protein